MLLFKLNEQMNATSHKFSFEIERDIVPVYVTIGMINIQTVGVQAKTKERYCNLYLLILRFRLIY